MRMKSLIVGLGASLAALPASAGLAQVAPSIPAEPHAPRITCSMTMQFWCIVQSGATVNMVDDGDDRIWSITTTRGKRPSVLVRENKTCDSPSAYHPARMKDAADAAPGKRGTRIVTLALTADQSCTLRISYPLGHGDWAREAERMAKYGLRACDKGACRASLLDIH